MAEIQINDLVVWSGLLSTRNAAKRRGSNAFSSAERWEFPNSFFTDDLLCMLRETGMRLPVRALVER